MGATEVNERDSLSILPQLGSGGWVPSSTKLGPASAIGPCFSTRYGKDGDRAVS